jgi:hypothetical protein
MKIRLKICDPAKDNIDFWGGGKSAEKYSKKYLGDLLMQ